MADGVGAFRCWAHIVKQICLYAVCREDVGHCLGKEAAVVAAVVAHYNGNAVSVSKILFKVVGETLCCHTDCIDVHAVGAGAHNAAKTARAEFQVFIETFYQVCLVGVVKH